MRRPLTHVLIALPLVGLLTGLMGGCALHMRAPAAPPSASKLAELWVEPSDLAQRDLFAGPGGAQSQPDPKDRFEFVSADTSGASKGFDVRDSQGREWSAKLGIEAPSEIAASRLIWAMGFHQPSMTYVPGWTLVRNGAATTQPAARFRLKPKHVKNGGTWAWTDNPFIGSDPFGGLVALMVVINNWDLKTSNNVLYQFESATDGAPEWFVVKDLGSSFGKTGASGMLFGRFRGSKNAVTDFEHEPFIKSSDGDKVTVHFHGGAYVPVLRGTIRASDVRWICERLNQLSDQQWHDAFRAAGYPNDVSDRYVKRLKEKVAEGLKIETTTR